MEPSINGQWYRSNMAHPDGIVNHWFFGASWAVLLIIDAVQEFKVQSHNDKAEYGGVLGGVMNIVSSPERTSITGTHGGSCATTRSTPAIPFTDANAMSQSRRLHQNQAGATFGGPVWIPETLPRQEQDLLLRRVRGLEIQPPPRQNTLFCTDRFAELTGDFSHSPASANDCLTR